MAKPKKTSTKNVLAKARATKAKPTKATLAKATPPKATPPKATPAKAKPVKAKPAKKSGATAKPAKATLAKKSKAAPAKATPAVAIPSDPVSDRWWDIIERSGKGAADPEEQGDTLIGLLELELTPDEIIAFDQFVNERLRDAFRWDLWGVAYIMNGGCSDDGFDYFCGWLVGKGRKHYYAALANPEDAAKGVSPDDEPFENEAFWYAASHAWVNKSGKTDGDFELARVQVMRSLIGEPFDEDTIYDKHPKLATKFNG